MLKKLVCLSHSLYFANYLPMVSFNMVLSPVLPVEWLLELDD